MKSFPRIFPYVLDLFFWICSNTGSYPTEGVLMRRMRTGRDAAPAGSVYATGSPGASGDIARPNYVGPSGNGLVERMKAGESPWNQGRSNGRPCPFPEGGPEDEGKTPR